MAPPEALLSTIAVGGIFLLIGLIVGGFFALALHRGKTRPPD
jgi:hypothetical protein